MIPGEVNTRAPIQIVVVSAGSNRDAVISAMSRWSIEPISCPGVNDARHLLRRAGPSLVFCEEELSDGTYRDLLRDLARVRRTQLVVISGNSDLDQVYREATALGAFDTIASPCRPADVQWVVIRALQQAQRRARNKRRREPSRFGSPGPVAPVL